MAFQARLESDSLVDGEIGKDLFFGLTFTKDLTFQKKIEGVLVSSFYILFVVVSYYMILPPHSFYCDYMIKSDYDHIAQALVHIHVHAYTHVHTF